MRDEIAPRPRTTRSRRFSLFRELIFWHFDQVDVAQWKNAPGCVSIELGCVIRVWCILCSYVCVRAWESVNSLKQCGNDRKCRETFLQLGTFFGLLYPRFDTQLNVIDELRLYNTLKECYKYSLAGFKVS